MNKEQRNTLKAQGIEVLRAQFDAKKGNWRIVKYTSSGGWAKFGASTGYVSRAEAENAIVRLCNAMPSNYANELK